MLLPDGRGSQPRSQGRWPAAGPLPQRGSRWTGRLPKWPACVRGAGLELEAWAPSQPSCFSPWHSRLPWPCSQGFKRGHQTFNVTLSLGDRTEGRNWNPCACQTHAPPGSPRKQSRGGYRPGSGRTAGVLPACHASAARSMLTVPATPRRGSLRRSPLRAPAGLAV